MVHPKIKILSSFLSSNAYRFGTTWRWVNYDKIVIFRWNMAKHSRLRLCKVCFLSFLVQKVTATSQLFFLDFYLSCLISIQCVLFMDRAGRTQRQISPARVHVLLVVRSHLTSVKICQTSSAPALWGWRSRAETRVSLTESRPRV